MIFCADKTRLLVCGYICVIASLRTCVSTSIYTGAGRQRESDARFRQLSEPIRTFTAEPASSLYVCLSTHNLFRTTRQNTAEGLGTLNRSKIPLSNGKKKNLLCALDSLFYV